MAPFRIWCKILTSFVFFAFAIQHITLATWTCRLCICFVRSNKRSRRTEQSGWDHRYRQCSCGCKSLPCMPCKSSSGCKVLDTRQGRTRSLLSSFLHLGSVATQSIVGWLQRPPKWSRTSKAAIWKNMHGNRHTFLGVHNLNRPCIRDTHLQQMEPFDEDEDQCKHERGCNCELPVQKWVLVLIVDCGVGLLESDHVYDIRCDRDVGNLHDGVVQRVVVRKQIQISCHEHQQVQLERFQR